MDAATARHLTRALLDQLTPRLDPDTVRFASGDLDAGEQGMALNLLVTVLTRDRIPVSPTQRDVIRDVIVFFDLSDSGRRAHPALAGPNRATAQLIVVDNP